MYLTLPFPQVNELVRMAKALASKGVPVDDIQARAAGSSARTPVGRGRRRWRGVLVAPTHPSWLTLTLVAPASRPSSFPPRATPALAARTCVRPRAVRGTRPRHAWVLFPIQPLLLALFRLQVAKPLLSWAQHQNIAHLVVGSRGVGCTKKKLMSLGAQA